MNVILVAAAAAPAAIYSLTLWTTHPMMASLSWRLCSGLTSKLLSKRDFLQFFWPHFWGKLPPMCLLSMKLQYSAGVRKQKSCRFLFEIEIQSPAKSKKMALEISAFFTWQVVGESICNNGQLLCFTSPLLSQQIQRLLDWLCGGAAQGGRTHSLCDRTECCCRWGVWW